MAESVRGAALLRECDATEIIAPDAGGNIGWIGRMRARVMERWRSIVRGY